MCHFTFPLQDDESIDDLQHNGLRIIQKSNCFRFGVDAVLLAGFAKIKKNAIVVDLGTGTGIIPILLAGYTHAEQITGIEIQAQMAQMAARSITMNGLDSKIKIINGDIKDYVSHFQRGQADVVLSNPPYMKKGNGLQNAHDAKAIARHELQCAFSDVARAASYLLHDGGLFYLIHRPERLVDLLTGLRENNLEPKQLKWICPKKDALPNLVLIKAIKSAAPGLQFLHPFFIYDETGAYHASFENMKKESGNCNKKE